MRSKVAAVFWVVLFLAAALTAGCGSKPAENKGDVAKTQAPKELAQVTLAGAHGFEFLPFVIAEKKGFFAKEGIKLNIVNLPSTNQLLPALASESVDVIMTGNSPAFINMVAEGFPGRIVSGHSNKMPKWWGGHLNGILVRKNLYDDGTVKNVGDLKGRKVAFNSRTRTETFDRALEQYGLSINDIEIVEIAKFGDSMAALQSKAVDAAFFIQPFGMMAVSEGYARYLLEYSDLPWDIQFAMIIFNERLVKKDRDLGFGFLKAVLLANREYIKAARGGENRKEIVDVTAGLMSMKPEDIEKQTWPYINPNGDLYESHLKSGQDWYFKMGLIKQKVDFSSVTDLSLRDKALAELGKVDPEKLVGKK